MRQGIIMIPILALGFALESILADRIVDACDPSKRNPAKSF